ncbi:MAG: hypothetical protein LBL41_01465 [Bifidobacteriaceae bacterium]|jgi:hypothetical protein|nr:hypothetical protein [Bifidobacteriaceae bacterium]
MIKAKKILTIFSFFLACTLFLSACQGAGTADNTLYKEEFEQSVSPSSAPTISGTEERRSPLDEISLVSKKGDSINKALDILVTVCMKERGFTYTPQTGSSENDADSQVSETAGLWTQWGIFDVGKAKKFGYTIEGNGYVDENGDNWFFDGERYINNDELYREQEAQKKNENLTADSEKENTVYYECDEKAVDEFYKSLDVEGAKKRDIGALGSSANVAAEADSRMVSLVGKWSDCMSESGYKFATPLEAREKTFNLEEEHDWNSKHKKDEILVATADATCKTNLNFLDTWYDILYEHENRVIQENLPLFNEEKAYVNSLVKRAEDIIKEYG